MLPTSFHTPRPPSPSTLKEIGGITPAPDDTSAPREAQHAGHDAANELLNLYVKHMAGKRHELTAAMLPHTSFRKIDDFRAEVTYTNPDNGASTRFALQVPKSRGGGVLSRMGLNGRDGGRQAASPMGQLEAAVQRYALLQSSDGQPVRTTAQIARSRSLGNLLRRAFTSTKASSRNGRLALRRDSNGKAKEIGADPAGSEVTGYDRATAIETGADNDNALPRPLSVEDMAQRVQRLKAALDAAPPGEPRTVLQARLAAAGRKQFVAQQAALGIQPGNLASAGWEEIHAHSLTLDACHFYGKGAVLAWKIGPRRGEVYDVVPLPSGPAPSMEDLLASIDHALDKVGERADEGDYMSAGDELRKLVQTIYSRCHGLDGSPGWARQRFIHSELNNMMCKWDQDGITAWLAERYRQRQTESALRNNLDPKRQRGLADSFAAWLDDDMFSIEVRIPQERPLLRGAATWQVVDSDSLDSLLAGEGMPDRMKVVVQSSSGAMRDARLPHDVQASVLLEESVPAGHSGFAYPIVIGRQGSSSHGADKPSISAADAILVPPFAMDEVARILLQHGHGHIPVLPLEVRPIALHSGQPGARPSRSPA